MTCKRASLSGAMYHGFEGAISTFGVYFPYLDSPLDGPTNQDHLSPPNVDYAMTKKRKGSAGALGLNPHTIQGSPRSIYISTSYIERLNLTVRMSLKRVSRSVNAFFKSLKHLRAAVSLFFAYYNFCRVHSTLRVTPAMEAGIADHVWGIEEILRFCALPYSFPA